MLASEFGQAVGAGELRTGCLCAFEVVVDTCRLAGFGLNEVDHQVRVVELISTGSAVPHESPFASIELHRVHKLSADVAPLGVAELLTGRQG